MSEMITAHVADMTVIVCLVPVIVIEIFKVSAIAGMDGTLRVVIVALLATTVGMKLSKVISHVVRKIRSTG
jgi:hypothetical protein